MQELIERLRSYLPLGLECHWSQASKNYVTAFDLIESQAAEIASLQETLGDVTMVASDAEKLVISQRDEIAALTANLEAAEQDAARYRFWKDWWMNSEDEISQLPGAVLDAITKAPRAIKQSDPEECKQPHTLR